MVGLQDQLKQLKDLVLRETRKDRLILVKGMTGIGKTTLVQEIYKDPLVEENFDAYLFLSFGPVYQLKEILLLALFQLGVHSGNFHENGSVEQLQGYVKEFLSYKRYLIVLDNVWDGSAFEELCDNILPHEEMSSCVIFTSQTISLSSSYYHCTESLHIRFLDDEESWNLLREMVFTSDRECCDRRLEKIGRKIAKNCDGLPLAIIQVGELLRKTKKTVDIWEEIAEKEDPLTITMEDDTPLSNSLCLSYTMLPQYLKLCFLYMCVFPKNYKISRSKLIQLWVSEGFIQKKNLEETAGGYLDELVSQSCVLSEELRSIHLRQTKTCRLHFTFRSLCVSEAKRTNFSHFVRKYIDCFPESIDNQQQRLCIHNNVVLGFKQVHQWIKSVKDARSLLCFGPLQQYPIILHLPYGLLKVLDVLAIRFYEFPHQVLDLIQLRYLAVTCDEEIPPSVSRLLNLESLVLLKHHNIKWSKNVPVYLPIEIWKLSKLKHLQCMGLDLPDPSIDDSLSLGRLLTLSGVSAHSCTHRVLARMPMLKRIGIKIDSANDSIETAFSLVGDFTALNHNFESFKCMVMYPNLLRSQVIPSHPNFPKNVRKISLGGCGFPWKYMRVIGALPSLQVLKLRCNAFCGPEWKIDEIEEEKQFHSLEHLLLEDLDLEDLVIQHSVEYNRCFRELKRLVIRHCYKLQEIPSILMWVDLIEVDNCSLSLEKQIQDWRSTEGRHEFLIKSAREDKN